MGIRVYLCPVIGDGLTPETGYRAGIVGKASRLGHIIPSNPDGTPKFSWCLSFAHDIDWTVPDGDAELERLFGIDLPDSIDTFAELRTYLQGRTVGEIPAARRTALDTRLTNKGVDTSSITLQSTWWEVAVLVVKHLTGEQNPRVVF